MISRRAFSLLVSLFFAFSTCVFVQGQSTYGSITGSVTDPSGAAIAAAQVTLTNLGTAEKQVQPTGSDGLYSFVNLIPGNYRIDVEKPGFKRITQGPVVVQVQQTSKIDVSLPIGQATETVEVTSETPLLQSETSSLGQVIDARKATELPLNGRNIYNLAAVAPSVIPQGNTQGSPVGKNPFDFANYQIGGSFANESAEYLDGQPLNIGYINLPALVPTADSISEFKVQYNNLGPEWGKFSGGVINLSTKSGTNTWHGSAYDYLRNKVFNSNEYFNKGTQVASGLKNEPPPFTQNQFGATIGGAVIKNKTFVFGSYEGFRLRTGTVFNTTVPTLAERGGDFGDQCLTGFGGPGGICSDVDSSGNSIHQLYDPLSVNLSTGVRTPIANNNLNNLPYPMNPTALYLLNSLIPDPLSGGISNNFIKAASTGGDVDEYVARVDQNITTNQRVFGRFSYWKLLSLAQDPFGTGLCKDRCQENTRSKSLAIGYNWVINPTTIANFNISASRFHYLRLPINSAFDMSQEGWPSAYNSFIPDTERTPLTPCFGNSDSLVTCSQGQSSIDDFNTQFNISPQITMIRGRHTITWGGQLQEGYDNYLQTNTGGGLISFVGSWTTDKVGSNLQNGKDFADFLLGFGQGQGSAFGNQTSGSLVISGPVSGKQTYRAFYVGDNWHVTTKLTLNLGLRYELQGTWSERYDKMTYFDPAATNSSVTGCSGAPGSPCPGDLFLVKTGVNTSRNNLPLSKKQFMPRLGFAYGLDQKTVIRGGYGVFFIPNYVSFNTNPYVDPVSSATSNFIASADSGFTPASTLTNSGCTLGAPDVLTCDPNSGPFFPGPTLTPVAGRNPIPNVSQYAVNQSNFSATGYTVQKYGYVQQWNFGIQRELPWGFFADVAYAGSHGVHLPQSNTNINQIPDSFIRQAAAQEAASQPISIAQIVPNPFTCPLCNTPDSLPGALSPGNLRQGQLDRPYPQYTGLNLNGLGCCSSNYNSLQATVNKRFGGGGTLLVAYTNSKLLSNTDTLTSWLEGGVTGGVGAVQDWNNLAGERSLSSQDVSQRLAISYVLDLPFGRGKRYLGGMTGVADKLVSGWGIDGVTVFQRGFPVKISYGQGTPLSSLGLGIGTLRPDVVPGCKKATSGSTSARLGEWFNTSCFAPPGDYAFGDESRVDPTLRQDGAENFDFAIFKKTTIAERASVEFRTEFFDLFNHPQFGPPNGTCCLAPPNGNFGQVTNTINNPRLIQFALKFEF
ncbi:MAG: TonB-dependent receptor domain-containing protein [Terriglobales bacterium]